ncbi:MAG: histidine phosphatase family protein [Planctomycetes bacterium]|nr:histidine phosphatase family protein [Planctomycetota bacterium]
MHLIRTRSVLPLLAVGALLLSGLVLAAGAAGPARQGAPAPTGAEVAPARPRTVLFVRHAEKDASGDPKDPGLSAAGSARAQALAELCGHTGATHLFASEYKRTRETLAPLAARLGVEVRVVSAAKPDELVRALDALPAGSVAVVAGHSNTVPDLVARLGGELGGLVGTGANRALPDDAFDRLVVVTRPAPEAKGVGVSTLELRYGHAP